LARPELGAYEKAVLADEAEPCAVDVVGEVARRVLLIETDLPVKAIGMQCGFENDSYFFRQFKREMNVSPLVFRKMHREPYDGSGGIIDLS